MDGNIDREEIYEKKLSFSRIRVRVTKVGEDYSILTTGGEKPHIGCTVLSVPRPSLTGDGSVSVTSSVINLTGHKDEKICRYLAEQTAKKKNAVVSCSGGFHMDDITETQITEVMAAVAEIAQEISKG
ncbi:MULTISPECIES: prenylated flavin chaperone LpdD [Faecalicatena]|uniref:prenylated flavin chaperone LpdD n=1 Tax=Faecalicatena TaxID=2005359 RepID=UPI001FE30E19|nr:MULTISPECIES: hypothetical protein [Faecalicatena]MCI6465775.1 hypothetical protein [Faecalicatena sp.]MDY5618811.1 hypothetical protein [Lachnospiraceae bacterium]